MISFVLYFFKFIQAIGRSWQMPYFRSALTLAGLILLSGTIFYRNVEGWSWIDALYFSVTTISTVGFGDLSPQTPLGKLFTVFYIFIGVGVFVALAAQFARALFAAREEAGSPDKEQ